MRIAEQWPSRAQIESLRNDIAAQTVRCCSALMKSALSWTGRATPPSGRSPHDTLPRRPRALRGGFIVHFCLADASTTGDFNQHDQSLVARGIHDICFGCGRHFQPSDVSAACTRRSTGARSSAVSVKSNLFSLGRFANLQQQRVRATFSR